jgi:hypothetical protein
MQFAWQHTRRQDSKEEVQPILEHEDSKASWLGQEAPIITTQGRVDIPSPFSPTARLSQQSTFAWRHVQSFLSCAYHHVPISLSCTFGLLPPYFASTFSHVQSIFACALGHVQGYIACTFGYVQSFITCSFYHVSSRFAKSTGNVSLEFSQPVSHVQWPSLAQCCHVSCYFT